MRFESAWSAVSMASERRSLLSLARLLKLQQLAVFEKVVETGTIMGASRELAMTQPAVTKSLRELEQHLGEPLFLRGKRGVTLTEFGSAFEPHARSILAELRRLAAGLDGWRSGTFGQVAIGSLLTASATLLPDAITHLHRAAPDVTVEVQVGTNASLFPALARGDLDIVVGFVPELNGLVRRRDQRVRLIHVKLHDEALCAVVGREQSVLVPCKGVLRDLYDLDWILPTPDSVAFGTVCAMFDKEKLPLPARVVYSVSVLTNIGLLTRRPMVALMPRSTVEPFRKTGTVTILPLKSPVAYGTVGYTIRADRERGGALQRFIASLEEASRRNAGDRHKEEAETRADSR